MKILAVSIFLALLFGLGLNALASKKETTFLDIKPIAAAKAETPAKDGWALLEAAAAKGLDQSPAAESAETADEKVDMSVIDTSNDDPDPAEEENYSHEIPEGLPAQGSRANQLALTRCVQEAAQDKALIQELCPGKLSQAAFCSVENIESGGTMCLGALQGEPCQDSPKGAQGRCQVMPRTAAATAPRAHVVDPYNPQNLEHNKRVAIAYLCHMMETVGETNMYRAYNGGPAGFNDPKRQQATIAYDRYVRERIPVFQAALEGKIDLGAVGTPVSMVERSRPLPDNAGPITSVLGEPRPYRNGTHRGDDASCRVGTPAYAIRTCKVVSIGWNKSGGMKSPGFYAGNKVIMNCGNGTPMTLASVRYFHLSSESVKVGDVPKAGQPIGFTGDTGGKTGKIDLPHLHIETWVWGVNGQMIPDNPCNWFDCSTYIADSPRYKGSKDQVWKAAYAKFWAIDSRQ